MSEADDQLDAQLDAMSDDKRDEYIMALFAEGTGMRRSFGRTWVKIASVALLAIFGAGVIGTAVVLFLR